VAVLVELPVQGPTVLLREAVADDVPAIVELLAADQLGATRDGIASQDDLQLYLRAFSVLDTDPAHLLLVGTDGADVIATMQLSFLPGLARRGARRAQLETVRVRKDYRNQGLGAAMFVWAIGEARRRGCAWCSSPLTSREKTRTDSTNDSASPTRTGEQRGPDSLRC